MHKKINDHITKLGYAPIELGDIKWKEYLYLILLLEIQKINEKIEDKNEKV